MNPIIAYSVFVLSCSSAQPDNCTRQYLGDIQTPTPIGCLMAAQPALRKWIEDYGGLRVFKALRCVDSRRKWHEMGRDQA